MWKAENIPALFAPFCLSLMLAAQLTVPAHAAAPPKELMEYVREASRLGLAEKEIRENAIKAGWPAAAVNEAVKNLKPPEPKASESGAPESAKPAEPKAAEPKAAGKPVAATKTVKPISKPAETGSQEAPAAEARPEVEKPLQLPDGYVIGAGDVLRVDVWDEPKASVGGAVVRPDGRIGMPLLKEVEVLGLTPAQAEQVITEKLAALIPGADVTVVVAGINSKKIYVIGGVKREGPIPYTYRMTVLQALSEAGGLNDYAKRKKIYILRTQNGKEYRLPFDYDAVLRGERMELNITMLPADTLIVPR